MYVIVWRFTTDDPQSFERHYGPEGVWARLFRRSAEYVRTDLLKSTDGSYLTLDWWTSLDAYNQFRTEHADDYALIDAASESVTSFEDRVGEFLEMGSDPIYS
jgi:hypothetical protein